jgi:hypothetical protein
MQPPQRVTHRRDKPGNNEPGAPSDGIDEASEASFPASDPPPWMPLHIGGPGEHPEKSDAAGSVASPPNIH